MEGRGWNSIGVSIHWRKKSASSGGRPPTSGRCCCARMSLTPRTVKCDEGEVGAAGGAMAERQGKGCGETWVDTPSVAAPLQPRLCTTSGLSAMALTPC
jgi:hypothetical protein